jgi:dipicolinate synthase subunit B
LDALLQRGYDVVPIVSERVWETDTRFGTARALCNSISAKCGKEIIHTIPEAEPLGPAKPLSALVICPCTGNTLAKLAAGVTDSAVCMAAKAHLRSDRPLLIALASNDAMSANLQNIATLLNRKNVFFVPVRQDDPTSKPHSLVADFVQVPTALEQALAGRQMRKLFL